MDLLFPLDIFPMGGLSSSVVTTVWVGVCVIVFLNLRFGLSLSGLVIPGYLIPLLLVKPTSAAITLMEGLVTYLLGKLLAEYLPRRFGYAEMFGRDRFFALILISIVVRLGFDGSILPLISGVAGEMGLNLDIQTSLHSFGLIIVSLIANQYWNSGIRAGTLQLGLYLGITYLIIRFLLITTTNFNINTLSYMYEDVATSILASPKAYIILITSAFIASRMNIKYGWEYNGILIPSLLALQWYQPLKLLATFAETLIIYLIGRMLLASNYFKYLNIEGSRELLFFFTLSFIYKWVLGFALITWYPEIKVTDMYGFGYLLATLLALKMYQKSIPIRVTRATLQTSIVSVIIASFIGFTLNQLSNYDNALPPTLLKHNEGDTIDSFHHVKRAPLDYLQSQVTTLYKSEEPYWVKTPNLFELEHLKEGFQAIKQYQSTQSLPYLERARIKMNQVGFDLHWLSSGTGPMYLVAKDATPERGWGFYIFNTSPKNAIVIEVPSPLDEPQAAEAGIWMFLNDQATALSLAGLRRFKNADGSSDTTVNPQTAFQQFHLTFSEANVLQLRAYTSETARIMLGVREAPLHRGEVIQQSTLWVKQQLPKGLNLATLQLRAPDLKVNWMPSPITNIQRTAQHEGFAELFLSPKIIRNWISERGNNQLKSQYKPMRIDGYLQEWLSHNKEMIAGKNSEIYQPPRVSDLIYFDENIISPLFQIIKQYSLTKKMNPNQLLAVEFSQKIAHLSRLSANYGYEITHYHHTSTQQNFLLLAPKGPKPQYHWGIYTFRLGAFDPTIIQVPHPYYEINSFEFGSTLFEDMNAEVMMISGAHPYANRSGTSKVTHVNNKNSLFNLIHQVWLREKGGHIAQVLQVRAFQRSSFEQYAHPDLILSFYGTPPAHFYNNFTRAIQQYNLYTAINLGEAALVGFHTRFNAQTSYLPMVDQKWVGTLWVSDQIRGMFKNKMHAKSEQQQFEASHILSQSIDLHQWTLDQLADQSAALKRSLSLMDNEIDSDPMSTESTALLKQLLLSYTKNKNIQFLLTIQNRFPNLLLQRWIDTRTNQSFLSISDNQKRLRFLTNLNPMLTHQQRSSTITQQADGQEIIEFISSRKPLLEVTL